MIKQPSKSPSTRQLRVGEEIRQTLGEYLTRRDFHLPELTADIHLTVTEVSVSPDLKNATVFISSLRDEDTDAVASLLSKNKKIFRHFLSKTLVLKFTPELTFKKDTSFEYARRMSMLFEKISEKE